MTLKAIHTAIDRGLLRFDVGTGSIYYRRYMGGKGGPEALPWRPCRFELVKGYHRFGFTLDGIRYRCMVHRAVWMLAHGQEFPDGMTINHVNGIKTDNRPSNLAVATYQENTEHAIRHGLWNPRSPKRNHRGFCKKLSPTKVRNIRAALEGGITQPALARKYGVSQTLISNIRTGKRYAWVK